MRLRTELLRQTIDAVGGESMSVLDVGSAVAETIEFFSQYRCKLHFADLIGEIDAARSLGAERIDFVGILQALTDARFDLILFWDVLNYIDRQDFAAFNDAITAVIHPRTIAHAFIAFTPGVPLGGLRLGVGEDADVVVKAEEGPAPHPKARAELGELLPVLRIDRGTLLQENRQELALVVSQAGLERLDAESR